MTFYRVVEDAATVATPSTERQATLQAAHLEVKMFNVGKGEAVLIVFPNSNAWLIDVGCNSTPANTQLGNWVVQYLVDQELTLEVIVLSHAHFDHAGAAETIIPHEDARLADPLTIYRSDSRWGRGDVWLGRYWAALGGPYVDEVITEAHSALILNPGIDDVLIKDGHQDRPIPNGVAHFFAGSGKRAYTSLFVQLEYNDATLLFAGDVNADYEIELLAAHEASHFRSDLLKVTHHGSQNGSHESFLAAVRPGIAIASTGADDGHRLEQVIKDRLEGVGVGGRGATVFETLVDGDITIKTDGATVAGGAQVAGGERNVLYSVEYSAEFINIFDDGSEALDPGLFAFERGLAIQLDGGR